jgi:hypothetical protein
MGVKQVFVDGPASQDFWGVGSPLRKADAFPNT